ncbi:uncharacterized protein PAF06_011121 [Gastrophryne carolinensis]
MSTKGHIDSSVIEQREVNPATRDSDKQGTDSMFQEEQIVRSKRVSKPTLKIIENYEVNKEEFCDNLDVLWQRTEHYIAAISRNDSDAAKITTTLNRLSAAYEGYQRLSAKYITFLSNADFDDATAELAETETLLQTKDTIVKDAKDKAELRIAHLQEVRSHQSTSTKRTQSSSRTSRSRRSALHDRLIEIRADAEEASVRSAFAKKEAEIAQRRTRAEMAKREAEMAQRQAEAKAEMVNREAEAQLKILQMEKEEAAALAKLKVLEQALGQDTDLDGSIPAGMEVEDPADRTANYVLKQSSPTPPAMLPTPAALQTYHTAVPVKHQMMPPTQIKVISSIIPADPPEAKPQLNPYATSFNPDSSQPHMPEYLHAPGISQGNLVSRGGRSDMSDFARYMIRRELINISLSKFDDHAENYRAWKSTFEAVSMILTSLPKRNLTYLLTGWAQILRNA